MHILLAPSEAKSDGGLCTPINPNSFIFDTLYDYRLQILNFYNKFISNASMEELKLFFELKNEQDILAFKQNIFTLPTKKAIQRYSGVAYDSISYDLLSSQAQQYIDDNVLIFSNLFGVVKASDCIPTYKYKQGAKLQNINVEYFYKTHFSQSLDEYLDGDIIDLRAKFYDKFYTIKKDYVTFTFLYNNKVVSHYAKKYRGLILKYLAINKTNSIKELYDINFENLQIKEIIKSKNKQEIVFDILDK